MIIPELYGHTGYDILVAAISSRERKVTRAQVGRFWRVKGIDSSCDHEVHTDPLHVHILLYNLFVHSMRDTTCQQSTKGWILGLRWRFCEIYPLFFWEPFWGRLSRSRFTREKHSETCVLSVALSSKRFVSISCFSEPAVKLHAVAIFLQISRRKIADRARFNPLAPNDLYIRRTAQLTSRRCILNIYSTNILTEYFKHTAHSPFFFKMPFIS